MYGGAYREALIPSLLELFNIPYVFSQPDVMLKTLDKNLCNFVVEQFGIKVPNWYYLLNETQLEGLQTLKAYPYIVKLSHEGSGIGISNASIVHDYQELCERVKLMFETYKRPLIVQKFIEGIETTIGVAGSITNPTIFQLVEVELLDSLVYGISEKENSHIKTNYIPLKNEKLESQVNEIAKIIYTKLNCQDAARIDFRIEKGTLQPYFIEINPLPHLHPIIGDFCRSASMANFSYESTLNLIMSSALQRIKL
jgi:D-alanine-D-alanine ligase